MPKFTPPSWIQPLVKTCQAAVRQDPKKAKLIAGITMVMVGLSMRLLMSGPTPATAASPVPAAASRNVADNSTSPRPRGSGEALTNWLNAEKRSPRRNLFAADGAAPEGEQVLTTRTASQIGEQSLEDGGFWDEVAKSLAAQADHRREQQARTARLKRAGGSTAAPEDRHQPAASGASER
jgi:hypothetical protein